MATAGIVKLASMSLHVQIDSQTKAHESPHPAQERLAALAREREEAAVADCTFKPAINHRSERLMADRSTVLRVRLQKMPQHCIRTKDDSLQQLRDGLFK